MSQGQPMKPTYPTTAFRTFGVLAPRSRRRGRVRRSLSRSLLALWLLGACLFGQPLPVRAAAPAGERSAPISVTDPGARPPAPGEPGSGAPAIESTTAQPEFTGNAANVQAVVKFDEVNSRTGAFTFTIPVEMPPGVIGLVPDVSLSYSSDGPADSLLGVGFTLSADDCIDRRARGRQTVDGRWVFGRGVPEFSDTDLYYLHGERLVRCDDQAGGATASCPAGTYRAELNDFEKVEKQPAAVPNGFRVNKRDGTVVDYGYARLGTGRSPAFNNDTQYCVSRIAKEGNTIDYAYQDFGNGFSPISTIDYGGQDATTHRWRIRFNWVDRPAAEIRDNWSSGALVRTTKRLGSIDVLALPGLSRIRKVQIAYEAALSPDSGRSRVQSVQELGTTDADALPAQTFAYPPAGTHGWTGASWSFGGPPESGLSIDNAFVNTGYEFPGLPGSSGKQYMLGTYVADLDGDGYPDLVRHDDQVSGKVWLNRGPTSAVRWTLDSTWSSRIAAVPHFFGGTPPNVFDQGVRLVDLNGDSYPDIVQGAAVIPPCGGTFTTQPSFYVALYDPATGQYRRDLGTGFETFLRTQNLTLSMFSRTPCNENSDILYQDPGVAFADVNGDGLIDLIVARDGYTDPRFTTRTDWNSRREVWLNDGTTFVAPPAGTFQFPVSFLSDPYDAWSRYYGVHVADVNGDGLPDIVQVVEHYNGFSGPLAEKIVHVWLHNGTGWTDRPDWAAVINQAPLSNDSFNIYEYESLPAFPWTIDYPMGTAMLDLNGDGVDDFTRGYCWSTNCSYFVTYLSNANGQWTNDAGYRLINQLVMHSSSLIYSQDWDGAYRFADLDRDGLVDEVGNGLFATNPSGQGGQAGFVRINNMRVDRDRMTSVTNGNGGHVTIAYGAATQVLNPNLPLPKIVVTSLTLDNGRTGGAANGAWSTDRLFSYMGGRYDTSRREFAGFRVVGVRTSVEGRLSYKTTWRTNGPADLCHPAEEQAVAESELFCPPGPFCFIGSAASDFAPQITPTTIGQFVIDSFKTNTYPACSSDTVGPFFAPLSSAQTQDFDPSRPTLAVVNTTEFWYDDYGNPWASSSLKNPSDTITYRDAWTQFSPPAPGGPWILDRPCASGTITPQGGANLARQAAYFYYDGSTTLCAPVTVGRATRMDQYAWNGQGLFTGLDFVGSKTFAYTAAGNLSAVTDERGNTTTLAWDSTLPEILPRAVTDPALHTTQFAYDAYGNVQTITDANQAKSETRYDNLQRPIHKYKTGANGADPAPDETIAYLGYGSPSTQHTTVTDAIDAARAISSDSYFDGMGRVYLQVARDGATTQAVSHAFSTSGQEWKTTLPYAGSAFSLTQPLTETDYDALGRPFLVTLPGGTTIGTTYALWDAGTERDRWQTHTYKNGATVERIRHELYDQFDRIAVVTECDSTTCSAPLGSTDPATHYTTYTYDGADNLTAVALSDAASGPSRILRFFDGLGRLIAFKDTDGSNCNDATPDDIHSGCPWRYLYDAKSNLVEAHDPRDAVTPGLGTRIALGYDELDRLTSKDVARGNVDASFTWEYDEDLCGGGAFRGHLTRETYQSERPLDLGTPPLDAPAVDSSGYGPFSYVFNEYCYDSLGRKSRDSKSVNLINIGVFGPYVFDYSYLKDDSVASVHAPDGDLITRGYDALGRPASLSTTAAGTVVSNVTYDGAGRLDTLTYGSGLSYRQEYRIAAPVADQRLRRISTPGTPIVDLTFDYDPAGNVKAITNAVSGLPETFDYDRLNRLSNYYRNSQLARSYGYDSLGNRLSSVSNAVSGLVANDPTPPLSLRGPALDSFIIPIDPDPIDPGGGGGPPPSSTTYTSFGHAYGGVAGPHAPLCLGANQSDPCSAAQQVFSYDTDGNLVSSANPAAGTTTSYSYDLENRLRSISTGAGPYANYYYGPSGETVAVDDNGSITVTPDRSYQVRAGQVVHQYFLEDRRVASRPQGQNTTYVLADQVGSTRALVDGGTGTVVKRLDYDPFGETRNESGAAVCAERFDGMRRDAFGLDDFGARHYDPARGVFLQPDSTTPDFYDPQTLNRYAFPNNNPVTLSDPSGHEGEDWPSDVWISIGSPDNPLFVGPEIEVLAPRSLTGFEWMQTGYGPEYYYMQGWWMDAMGIRSVLDPDRYAFHDSGPPKPEFHKPDIPPMTSPGGYTGTPDLPLEGPGFFDPVDFLGGGLAGLGKGLFTSALRAAAEEGVVSAGRSAVTTTGNNLVYHAVEGGTTRYIGITNNLARRAAQQLGERGISIDAIPGLEGLSRADARAVEQALIEHHGLEKSGGTLINKINSIARSNPIYADAVRRGQEILRRAGYPGF